jgi:hypothetical protein
MLKGLPRQIWEIFLPDTLAELTVLESNILAYRSRETDREKVITIQKLCGFPLRPNMPLREAITRLKIHKKKKNLSEWNNSNTDRKGGQAEY